MPTWFSWLSLILTAVGAIGLATLGRLAVTSREYGRLRRYLRFSPVSPLSIILVTSGHEVGGIPEVPYKRPLVSLPTLQAAAILTEVLGRLRYSKPVLLSVSETLRMDREGDIALLGGPVKNRVSAEFVERFNELHPDLAISREPGEDGCRWLRIGDWERCHRPKLQPDGNPANDLALVLAWCNPFCVRRRRGLLCAGFTSWGTAAAARFFAQEFPRDYYAWAKRDGLVPGALARGWPCYVAALDVSIVGVSVVAVHPCFFARIETPKASRMVSNRVPAPIEPPAP